MDNMPDMSEVKAGTLTVVRMGKEIVVRNPDQYREAGAFIVDRVEPMIRKVHERLDPIVDHAFQAHKGLTTLRKDLLKPLEDVKYEVGRCMSVAKAKWDEEDRERQRKAQEKAEREAQEKADREREETLKAARAARADGDSALASALKEEAKRIEPEPVLAPEVQSKTPDLPGVSSRKRAVGRVVSLPALLRHLADNPDAAQKALKVSQEWLNAAARAGNPIPGVKFGEDDGMAFGVRRA